MDINFLNLSLNDCDMTTDTAVLYQCHKARSKESDIVAFMFSVIERLVYLSYIDRVWVFLLMRCIINEYCIAQPSTQITRQPFIAECRMQMYVIASSPRSSLLHCSYSLLWSTGNWAIKRSRLQLLCCVSCSRSLTSADLCSSTPRRAHADTHVVWVSKCSVDVRSTTQPT